MPLASKKQVAGAVESAPNVEATISGSDVLDQLEATWSPSQEFQDRQPTGGSLSHGIKPVGASSGEIAFDLDIKGSGTATSDPEWGPFLEAALFKKNDSATLDFATLSTDAMPGDTMTGDTSGATAVVLAHTQAGSNVSVPVMITSGTFSTSEQIDSALFGTNIGTAESTPTTASQGLCYTPESDFLVSVPTSAGWSGTPVAGEGVYSEDATGKREGAGWFRSMDSNNVIMEWAWGVFSSGSTLHTDDAGGSDITASVNASTTQTQGKTLTVQMIRDKERRRLTGCRTNLSGSADAGASGRWSITCQGSRTDHANVVPLTATGMATTTPPTFSGLANRRDQFFINGIAVPVKSMQIDLGIDLGRDGDGNSPQGDAGGLISGREPTLTVEVAQQPLNLLDLDNLWRNATTVAVGGVLGRNSGNRVSFVATTAQITDLQDGETDNVATYQITLGLRAETVTGDNELYVGHT